MDENFIFQEFSQASIKRLTASFQEISQASIKWFDSPHSPFNTSTIFIPIIFQAVRDRVFHVKSQQDINHLVEARLSGNTSGNTAIASSVTSRPIMTPRRRGSNLLRTFFFLRGVGDSITENSFLCGTKRFSATNEPNQIPCIVPLKNHSYCKKMIIH